VPLAVTGYETALVVVAACFIVFALVVALVIPRTRPSFPGNRLGIFLSICGILFVSQLTAVLVLAEVGEADEPVAGETTGTETTQTETTGTTTQPQGEGDPVAGKAIFTGSAGCGACHTLADAQTTGTVGPDLDQLKPSYDAAVAQVTNGGGGMPPFKGTLSDQQIKDVAAYVSTATQG
jgi:mono/diheme cytochrome c family protein